MPAGIGSFTHAFDASGANRERFARCNRRSRWRAVCLVLGEIAAFVFASWLDGERETQSGCPRVHVRAFDRDGNSIRHHSRMEVQRAQSEARECCASGLAARRFGSTQALISLQIALSLTLLVGAGLLTHSLLALENQNIGFERDHILLVRTDADLGGYEKSEYFALYRELSEGSTGSQVCGWRPLSRFTPESGSLSKGNFSLMDYTAAAGKKLDVADCR